MIVNMSEKATEQEINHIIDRIREAGYQPHVTRGTERTIVAAVGLGGVMRLRRFRSHPGWITLSLSLSRSSWSAGKCARNARSSRSMGCRSAGRKWS